MSSVMSAQSSDCDKEEAPASKTLARVLTDSEVHHSPWSMPKCGEGLSLDLVRRQTDFFLGEEWRQSNKTRASGD